MNTLMFMDLPYYLEMTKTAARAVLYGVIGTEVKKPDHLHKVSLRMPTDGFVVMDLVGLSMDGRDAYVKGRVLTIVPREFIEAAQAKDAGRLAVCLTGPSLKLVDDAGIPDLVQMFGWMKGNGGLWQLTAAKCAPFRKKHHAEFYQVVIDAYTNDWEFTYPVAPPLGYREPCGGYQFAGEAARVEPSREGVPQDSAVSAAGWGALTVDPAKGAGPGSVLGMLPPGAAVARLTPPTGDFGMEPMEGTFASGPPPLPAVTAGVALARPVVKVNQVEGRATLAPETANIRVMREAVENADGRVKARLRALKTQHNHGRSSEELVVYTAKRLQANWRTTVGGETGRALLKEALETVLPVYATERQGGQTMISEMLDAIGPSVVAFWVAKDGKKERKLSEEKRKKLDEGLRLHKLRIAAEASGDYDADELDALLAAPADEPLAELENIEENTEEYDAVEVDYGVLLDHGIRIMDFTTQQRKFLRKIYAERMRIYFAMLQRQLGMAGVLESALFESALYEVNMLAILHTNPYDLCLIDPSIHITDLDKLAMYVGMDRQQPGAVVSRNIAYMHNFMLDDMNALIRDNTVVHYDPLMNQARSGYLLSKREFDTLQAEGTLIKKAKIEVLAEYFDPAVTVERFELDKTGWGKKGNKFFQQGAVTAVQMVDDYLTSGVGVLVELEDAKLVADYVFAYKEVFIYDRLREISKNNCRRQLEPEELDAAIKTFEKMKGEELGLAEGEYKLEIRQEDAVRLLNESVICLTGRAGSGKTTTAEAQVFGMETFFDEPVHLFKSKDGVYTRIGEDGREQPLHAAVDSEEEDMSWVTEDSAELAPKEEEKKELVKVKAITEQNLFFSAPTGKAAGRLKEVVKRRTSTINSLFGIGGESLSLRKPTQARKENDVVAIFIDEMSMPNLNLMYDMVLCLPDHARIAFLGDIEQLPPIGFGKPFANLLTFLPTVVLNVTRRSASNSTLARNNQKIIEESDGVRLEDLEEGPDTRILQETEVERVVAHIENVCAYHLGRREAVGFTPVENLGVLKPDDIQVISPLAKSAWGVTSLNKRLQNIFNPRVASQPMLIHNRSTDESVDFRLGDRVIHTRRNLKLEPRFIRMGNTARMVRSTGVFNGDIGKIVGFTSAQGLEFDFSVVYGMQNEQDILAELEARYVKVSQTKVMWVEVQYTDIDLETGEPIEFVVLYRADVLLRAAEDYDVLGKDLLNLDLAYALTVHRIQGSEAPLTVVPVLQVGSRNNTFLSRNMIYTAGSRAKKSMYWVGDIKGPESALNRARKIRQTDIRKTLLDYV